MKSVLGLVDDAADSITEMLQFLMSTSQCYMDEGKRERKEFANITVPLLFWGHSLGGFVALRLGQLLEKRGIISIAHLIVSQCRAPQVSRYNISFVDITWSELCDFLALDSGHV